MNLKKMFFLLLSGMAWIDGMSQVPVQDFSTHPRVYTKRYSFWFEGNFNGTIAKDDSAKVRWQYQIDYQYRRMSDASYIKNGEYYNIFKDLFQNVIRPWIHYWLVPGKVRVSFSPKSNWALQVYLIFDEFHRLFH